jgi:hypothetical protein
VQKKSNVWFLAKESSIHGVMCYFLTPGPITSSALQIKRLKIWRIVAPNPPGMLGTTLCHDSSRNISYDHMEACFLLLGLGIQIVAKSVLEVGT